VEPEHLSILAHVLWDDPKHAKLCEQTIAKIANPVSSQINSLLLEAEQLVTDSGLLETSGGIPMAKMTVGITVVTKLNEIAGKLAKLKGNGRLETAQAYVKEQIRRIHVASAEREA